MLNLLPDFSDIWWMFWIACLAAVFSLHLIDEGQILDRYHVLISRLPEWLYMPLGGCGYCLAGQLSLWIFLFTGRYNPARHVFFIVGTIFMYHLIQYIWERLSD